MQGQDSQTHSPAPFDLQSTIELMENEAAPEVLCEYIKAAAVHLGTLVQDHFDAITALPSEKPTSSTSTADNPLSQITTSAVFRLYKIAIKHSQPKTPRAVRSASKRLLAALIGVSPPVGRGFVPAPAPITVAALYKIIISNGRRADMNVDEVYVEVGALKALTKNGVEVDSTEGIVGWLVQSLTAMQDEYIKWCKQTSDDDWDDVPRSRVSHAVSTPPVNTLMCSLHHSKPSNRPVRPRPSARASTSSAASLPLMRACFPMPTSVLSVRPSLPSSGVEPLPSIPHAKKPPTTLCTALSLVRPEETRQFSLRPHLPLSHRCTRSVSSPV
jgi:hypothetical protein